MARPAHVSRLVPARSLSTRDHFPGWLGGGLEPPTTGPEPAVLPITPPPNGRSGHDSESARRPSTRARRCRRSSGRGGRAGDSRSTGRLRTAPVSRSSRGEAGRAARRATREACEPDLGRRPGRAAWRGSRIGDQHDVGQVPCGCRKRATRAERLLRRPAVHLLEDGAVGHAVLAEVVVAGRRLGEAVARLPAAGDHDQRGEPRGRARGRGRAGSVSTGDGRPLYCAAPSTTMASAGRASSCARRLPHLHERHRRRRRAPAASRPTITCSQSGSRRGADRRAIRRVRDAGSPADGRSGRRAVVIQRAPARPAGAPACGRGRARRATRTAAGRPCGR